MTVHNVTIDGKIFLGRADEQKQFKAALLELLENNDQEHLPYICLLHGDGGIGKTTLAKRFRDIATEETPFAAAFQILWVDWEDERKRLADLQVDREHLRADLVFKGIHASAIRHKLGRQFTAYRKAIRQGDEAERKVAEIIAGDDSSDELSVLRSIGVGAI